MAKIKNLDLTSLTASFPEAKSGIHINPANKSKFTATKKATGKTTEELTHSKNPLTRKRAVFAMNAKHWHHGEDGISIDDDYINNYPTKGKYNDKAEIVDNTKLDVNNYGITPNSNLGKQLTTFAKNYSKSPKKSQSENIETSIMTGLGLVDQLIPNEKPKMLYQRPEEMNVQNLKPYGTGSQAIMDMGGNIPGVTGSFYGRTGTPTEFSKPKLKKIAKNGMVIADDGDNITDPTDDILSKAKKAKAIPNDYKPIGVIKGKNVFGKTTTSNSSSDLAMATNDGLQGDKTAYSKKMADWVSSGKYSPADLVSKKYITQDEADKTYSKMYKPVTNTDYLYTEPETPPSPTAKVTSPFDGFQGEPIYQGNSLVGFSRVRTGVGNDGSQSNVDFVYTKPNSSQVDTSRGFHTIPTTDWDNKFTHGTRHLQSVDGLDNYKVNSIQNNTQVGNNAPHYDDGGIVPIDNVKNNNGLGVQTHWGGGVKQLSNNKEDGGTMQFIGDSHDDGGIGMTYKGKPVEVEGKETGVIDDEGNLNIMGNMTVPGTNKKFKSVSKDLANEELKVNKLQDKSYKLMDEVDPIDRYDKLKANTAMINMKGVDIKQKQISEQKQWLTNLQNAMLDTAKEHNLDPQEMSKGNIKKGKYGVKIKADGGYKAKGYVDWGATDGRFSGGDYDMRNFTENRTSLIPESPYNPRKSSTNSNPDLPKFKINIDDVISRANNLNDLKNNTTAVTNNNDEQLTPTLPTSANIGDMPGQNDNSKSGITTNAENIKPLQLLAESYGFATNRVQPVKAQHFNPDLLTPYQFSMQDQLNENEASFKSAEKQLAYNPTAIAALKGQEYQANESIKGNEFRTNQQELNTIRNQNTQIGNEAKLRNLDIDDKQYERQSKAKSNTRTQNIDILNSISSKMLQNTLESKKLKLYENLYPNYRFNPETGKMELINGNAQIDMNASSNGGSNSNQKTTTTRNADGTIKSTRTTDIGSAQSAILNNKQLITAKQARLATLNPIKKDSGGKIQIPMVRKLKMLK